MKYSAYVIAQQPADSATRRRLTLMVAHEMRNLLTPLAYAAAALGRCADVAPPPQIHTLVSRHVTQMRRLIDDLVDIGCGEESGMGLCMQPLRLHEVIADAVEVARPVIGGRGVRLTIAADLPTAAQIVGDRCRLTQALSNVLINAGKFTPLGGDVYVEGREDTSTIGVAVRDTGVGIAPEDLPGIFEAGARASSLPAEGSHLGLAIARLLIESHGGTLSASSEGRGRGSEFVMRLPRRDSTPAA